MKIRCWGKPEDPLYMHYHDEEWGVPIHDDQKLFEFLILETFQAGLSWRIVLNKRENFRKAFAGFEPIKVFRFNKKSIERLMNDAGIIRNRLKIEAAVTNAKAFLNIQKEFGSFDKYMWEFVGGKPIDNELKTFKQMPTTTKESDAMSKDLKKRGFKFVGSTVCYSHMQAVGMVNDHLMHCFRYREIKKMH